MKAEIDPRLLAQYRSQYSHEFSEWRELGARHKARRILELTRELPIDTVLDCGAGEGAVASALAASGRFGRLCALEITDEAVQRIEARAIPGLAEVKRFDGYQIPYPDQAFDLVVASHVVEHVEHPRILLRELARVGRHQLLEVPLDYAPGFEADTSTLKNIGHINVYTPSTFRFLLETVELEIVREHLSRTEREVTRYNWYQNQGRRFSPLAEARLLASPLVQRVRRLLRGRARHEETGYDAFTVLTRAKLPPVG